MGSKDTTMASGAPRLSKRANEALKRGIPPALEAVLTRVFGPQYAPETPDGLLNIGVAENSLMADWLLAHYKKSLDLTFADLTYGDSLMGSRRLNKLLSKLFTERFEALKPVKHDQLVLGVGVSAVLDQLSEKLCDIGDSMLIATPYYNGFDGDLGARARVNLVGVDVPPEMDPASPEMLQHFEAKLEELKASRANIPRAVILCNPNNPLGFCYPKETLLAYCRFCQKHNLHLISDEIYALSVYENKRNPNAHDFISLLSIDVKKEADCDPARVHVLYGMSKDFGSNGLRVGVLVSQHNPTLVKAFLGSAILMKLSSPADMLWSSILGDEAILNEYLVEAQRRAADTLSFTLDWLDNLGIKHSNPGAGHFVWCDMTHYLPLKDRDGKKLSSKAEQESELFMRLLDDGNVYLAPGMLYHSTTPGFFRLTFTLRREYLKVGMERIESIIKAVERENGE